MGGGSYNSLSSRSRQVSTYSHQSREEVFKRKHIHSDMDPLKITIRESRDSEEHPESYPVIIALDETGSMGHIPELFIKNIMPTIMEKILEAGIPNPQVCFMGIGDSATGREEAPLQVGQFESSDELMEKWLTNIYLEGKGGGNGHESYPLVWYFAQRRIVTDAWEKRHHKGVIITIGDEPCQRILSSNELVAYIDENCKEDVAVASLLESVQEKWQVYHIHCNGSHTYEYSETNWEKLLGINAVVSNSKDGSDIAEIIPKLVLASYNQKDVKST